MASWEESLLRGTAKSATAAVAATGPHASSKANDDAPAAAPTPGAQRKRLSKGDIRWILNQKPLVPTSKIAALKRSNPELVPRAGEETDENKMRLYRLAKAFDKMEERRPRLQAWVRSELKSKGYIELDDETVRRRAEVQAVIDWEWPAIQAKMNALIVSEREDMREYYGGGEGGDADDESYSDETSEGGGESGDSDESEGEEEDDAE